MLKDDIQFYLNEFKRVLKPSGRVYLTAFIENDVKDVEENPEGYLSKSTGPLHRVRYNKEFFFTLVNDAKLRIDSFHPGEIQRTGQSVVILSHAE